LKHKPGPADQTRRAVDEKVKRRHDRGRY
jgi:hypothetical protein